MQVGDASLHLTLIMHEQAFGDYLTDHSLPTLESVGWRTGYSLSPGVWQSFVTIRSCNHLMRIISRYVDNTKKSEIS